MLTRKRDEKSGMAPDAHEILENGTIEKRVERMNILYKQDAKQPFAIQYSSIHKSTFDGNLSGVEMFLKKNEGSVDMFDIRGLAAIHIACERGHNHILDYLLSRDADVNLKSTTDQTTPLMIASREGHLTCVRTLLDHGARAFDRNRAGYTAMHFCAEGDFVECLEAIYDSYEDMKYRLAEEDKEKEAEIQKELEQALIAEYGEQKDANKEMFLARRAEEAPKLKLLVPEVVLEAEMMRAKHMTEQEERKRQMAELADPSNFLLEIKCNNGMRPLHIASQSGSNRVVTWLLQRSVDVTATDKNSGDSPLHKAARGKHFGICKALKAVGADDKKKNKINETAKQLLYDSNN